MRYLKIILVTTQLILVIGCNDTENISGELTINFTHHWDGENVASPDFNFFKYTNAHGERISISRLKYLISKISLLHSDGNTIEFADYYLVDVTQNNISSATMNIPSGTYSQISFTFGFDEADNTDGAYPDLNAESWNWPEMLGGGYHFLQLEGKYEDNGNENPFAYHMGTAKSGNGEFESNHFEVVVDLNELVVSDNATLEISMNVAEWFKNPIIWDLNEYDINLMPNYEAQKRMNQNGRSVFGYRE